MKKTAYRALRNKRGMALPAALIVLLVAGMLVGLSLYLVENMSTVIRMKTDDELRMNAALAGLEEGKLWILKNYNVDNHLPKRKNNDKLVTSSDMAGAQTSDPEFDFLVARNTSDIKGIVSGFVEGASYRSVVYDLTYLVGAGVDFTAEMPMNMKEPRNLAAFEGSSAFQGQSYWSMNRGGGGASPGSVASEYGFYLIRSTSTMNGIEKVIEQGVQMRE